MVVLVFLARLTGKRKLHSLPRGLHTGQEGWWSDTGAHAGNKQAPLCAPALYLPPRPGVTWSSAPFPPALCAHGTHDCSPQTIHPRQPEPSTLGPKLGDPPPAANFPLSPAGVWREDRHTPGWTDQLCGLACPPTCFPQVGAGPSNVLGLPVTLSGAPLWSGAGSCVGPTERPGVLPRCRKHVPLGPATPRKSWGLEPPLSPGFGRLVFSRSVLFPGKPGNNFCQFFLCRLRAPAPLVPWEACPQRLVGHEEPQPGPLRAAPFWVTNHPPHPTCSCCEVFLATGTP